MLALGVSLLVSVAATPPPSTVHDAEKLASTYDEASCDPAEGGECAEEQLIDFDAPPPLVAILDCENPFIQEMIGSCDLPKLTLPSLHVPTVRNGGNSFSVATGSGSSEHLSVVTTAASLDAAMSFSSVSLAPPPLTALLSISHHRSTTEAPRSRLDRPPRA